MVCHFFVSLCIIWMPAGPPARSRNGKWKSEKCFIHFMIHSSREREYSYELYCVNEWILLCERSKQCYDVFCDNRNPILIFISIDGLSGYEWNSFTIQYAFIIHSSLPSLRPYSLCISFFPSLQTDWFVPMESTIDSNESSALHGKVRSIENWKKKKKVFSVDVAIYRYV